MALFSYTKNAATAAVLLCIFGLSIGHYIRAQIHIRGSTKGSEEIGPIDNYTCTDNGAFPHEECDMFITCWNGSAILHRCTDVMLFDLRYNGCEYAEYVDCGDRHRSTIYPPTTTPPTTSTTQDPTAPTVSTVSTTPPPNGSFVCPSNGVFPHAERCEYYWRCYEDVAELVHCELDYLFDLKYNGCNFPDLTDCGDRLRPDPLPSTTTPPVTQTQPPVTQTEPPVTQTEPPVTQTEPPVTTVGTSAGTDGSSITSTSTDSEGPSTTTEAAGGDYVCPEPEGLFPDPEDCGAYYSCLASVATRVLCPEGLHFSPERQICDWPEAAGCEI